MGREISISSFAAAVTGSLITTQGGNAPGTPSILTPASGSVLTSYTPTFTTSSFFNYVTGSHAGSNWQIATDAAFTNIIYDLASTSVLTNMTVPANTIPYSVNAIYVRVRYINNNGYISSFSSPVQFLMSGTLSVSGVGSGSNVIIGVTYAGTGSLSGATLKLANNSNMTSPAVTQALTFTNNTCSVTIPKSSLPGFADFTQGYYFTVTSPTGTTPANVAVAATKLPVSDVLTSGTSYSIPAAFTGTIIARLIGGGGGGTNSWIYGAYHATAGGASGEAIEQTFTGVTGGESWTYTIGAAGTPRPDSSTLGANGGSTTLTRAGTTYTARGGTSGYVQNGRTVNAAGYGMYGGAGGGTNSSAVGEAGQGGTGLYAAGGNGSRYQSGVTTQSKSGYGYGAGGAGYTQYYFSDVESWGWAGGGGGGGLAGTETLAGGVSNATTGVQGAIVLYLIPA